MINDLYQMSICLKKKGLLQITTHNDIKEPAKNAGLYIEIDEDKHPVNLDFVPKEEFAKLWTHSKGNHNSFPIIRIQKPFINHSFAAKFDEIWKQYRKDKEKKINTLLELDFTSKNPFSDNIIVKEWSEEQLMPVCRSVDELSALQELINRFPKNQKEQIAFYSNLLLLIKERLSLLENPILDLLKDILIGSWDKDKWISKTQIAFDIFDFKNFQYKVKDVRLKNILIKELNKRDDSVNKLLETEV